MYEMKDEFKTGIDFIDEQHSRLFEIADEAYNLLKNDFTIDKYNQSYDGLSSVKINIGLIVRKAVMNYTSDLLVNRHQSWDDAFKKALEKNSGNEQITII